MLYFDAYSDVYFLFAGSLVAAMLTNRAQPMGFVMPLPCEAYP